MAELPALRRWNTSDNSAGLARGRNYDASRACRSAAYTSLPPLPQHPSHQSTGRWGEDPALEKTGARDNTVSGFDRYRQNFDSCHPVRQPTGRFNSCMLPKALYTDLSLFHQPAGSTSRHVPRARGCAVFHNPDPHRTDHDGRHQLTEPTRKALTKYVQKLYTSSGYEDTYQDTREFQQAKQSRDAQYLQACELTPCCDEAPTCCRILNHPDPCHWCWNGGLHNNFRYDLAKFESQLQDITKRDPNYCTGNPSVPCKRCNDVSCSHKDHCLKPLHAKKATTKSKHDARAANQENVALFSGEGFGPWGKDHHLDDLEEAYLLPSVYQFRFPSALHCTQTHNAHVTTFLDRHNPVNYFEVPTEENIYPWASLCRFEPSIPVTGHYSLKGPMSQTLQCQPEAGFVPQYRFPVDPSMAKSNSLRAAETVKPGGRNSWKFRDGNNLRVPCIADMLGNTQKTDCQKRFHAEHTETIPDLRDFRKYSKRVTFLGYNSSVFR